MAKRVADRKTRSRKRARSATTAAGLPSEVPGQLIVRFKRAAVEDLASRPVSRTASVRAFAAATPEAISGPLDLLRRELGLQSVKPLFVPDGRRAVVRAAAAAPAVHGALVRSATEAPREKLRGFQLVTLAGKPPTAAMLKRLRASDAIDFVEPVPNRWLCAPDPMLNRQWGLRAIRWFDGDHPDASRVHVAVLDSGIDQGHPDLQDAIEAYRHDGNGARDFLGHGTHVSGIIAALVNNAVGIAGVADCRLHCWKIFDDPPAGSEEQDFDFEFYSTALASALDSDIKVINLSIGGTASSQTEAAVFAELRNAGVVVAAAMGNEFEEGNPTEFPGAYPGVLAVGATDETDRRASFSCTGSHIGLVAPGVNILSTVPRQKAAFAATTDYDSWPGTSMATPHVAGAAAVLYAGQAKSKQAAEAIVAQLLATAKKVPAMKKRKFTKEYGAGLLDLAAALAVS